MTELPLRESLPNEQPVQWECARCGARLTGVLNERAPGDFRFNIFPTQVHFACDKFEQSPQQIGDFVRKMVPRDTAEEQRRLPRRPICLAAAAMPMDAERNSSGVAFQVLLHNITEAGVAFSHLQPIAEPLIALELWANTNEQQRVIVRIVRTRAVGHFYEIAGEFVTE